MPLKHLPDSCYCAIVSATISSNVSPKYFRDGVLHHHGWWRLPPYLIAYIPITNLIYKSQPHKLHHCRLPPVYVCPKCLVPCFLEDISHCCSALSPFPLLACRLDCHLMEETHVEPLQRFCLFYFTTHRSPPQRVTLPALLTRTNSETKGSAPSLCSNFPKRPQTWRAFLILRRTAV